MLLALEWGYLTIVSTSGNWTVVQLPLAYPQNHLIFFPKASSPLATGSIKYDLLIGKVQYLYNGSVYTVWHSTGN